MEKICLSERRIDEIKTICRTHHNDPGELINILHDTQNKLGYLPKQVQELIALELGIPASRVYGVVSFYSFFTMTPKGKYPISVCMGTACYVRGGEKVLDEFKRLLNIDVGGTTPDGLFSLDSLRCVGACGLAPVVMVGPRVYGRLKVADVKRIIDEVTAHEQEI
ncbi:MAG TPA: NAD(P)H-dependent oxidoreductase subunit E [Candidatus Alistipes avicola]|uniref:NAD(P)H-dependent oxidoreductase subunit E n=1 Tax=Candidatus Alistipes avicola TaxID=2838432 RepID=A0A9D2IDM3_9BACT|nr:NAD(P)H-dependent oxidoreductase subunit E [uncultured Alistipes sp.]HJA98162.1 NAD(P)H-dependent oxidoreductase subunit E [Candidatus Alistipes avicola]